MRPNCPTGCATASSLIFNWDTCPAFLRNSNIEEIYGSGSGMADVNDSAEWTTRLALPDNDPLKIFRFFLCATLPKPDRVIIEGKHGRQKTGKKTFNMNGTTDIITTENVDAMRIIECGAGFTLIGLRTEDKDVMFTYEEQDISLSADANLVFAGDTTPLAIEFDFRWEDLHSLEMIASPIS